MEDPQLALSYAETRENAAGIREMVESACGEIPARENGIVTVAMIESARSRKGGFTRKSLEWLGVPWPPERGWKKRIIGKLRVSCAFQATIPFSDLNKYGAPVFRTTPAAWG